MLNFINPITIFISSQTLYFIFSIGLILLFIYLINRYNKNVIDTTNQFYSDNIYIIPKNTDIKYILWNGDINSTYIIINLLIQDYYVQPLYFEKYTINKNKNQNILNTLINKSNIENAKSNIILKELSIYKNQQKKEKTNINQLYKIIQTQYPEFKFRLLPIIFITNIQKDSDFTTHFYNILSQHKQQYNNKLIHKHIEYFENYMRFIKYFNVNNIYISYNKNYIDLDIILFYLNNNNNNKIILPNKDIEHNNIKYLASQIIHPSIFNLLNI